MKYMKTFGLLAVAAAALMVFTGTASATELTSPKGTKLGVGAVVKAVSTNFTLHSTVTITCQEASGEGKITNAGGAAATVGGLPNLVEYRGCSPDTVTVLSTGSGEVHSLGGGTGTLTSSGAEVTVTVHRSVLGFPVTTHCIYRTENTHVGTVTDSSVTGGAAVAHIGSSAIPQQPTDGACGETATLTGSATVTSPNPIYID
jgi:hypothetical protein